MPVCTPAPRPAASADPRGSTATLASTVDASAAGPPAAADAAPPHLGSPTNPTSAEERLIGSGDVGMLAATPAHSAPSLQQPYDPDSDDEAGAGFGDAGSQGLDDEDEAAAAALDDSWGVVAAPADTDAAFPGAYVDTPRRPFHPPPGGRRTFPGWYLSLPRLRPRRDAPTHRAVLLLRLLLLQCCRWQLGHFVARPSVQ